MNWEARRPRYWGETALVAGLLLIPLGAVAYLLELTTAGAVLLVAGFGLGLSLLLSPLIDRLTKSDHDLNIAPALLPTFIGATLAAAAARASEDWTVACGIGYVALVWIYLRLEPKPPNQTRY
jgi:hypothetical protein